VSSYLVQEEDGVSRFTLEDGSGFILLEAQGPAPAAAPGGGIISVRRRRRIDIRRITQDDDEALALTLLLRTIRRRSTK
jgi:hypothetical protein